MNKRLQLLAVACTACMGLNAQISFGGLPPSFEQEAGTEIEARRIGIQFRVNELLQQDEALTKHEGYPPRIAKQIPVDYSLTKDATWERLPNGDMIGRLRIKAENALAIILSYDDFFIPQGASLYIYNQDRTQWLGAYTHETHPRGGSFSTEPIAGDDITLELVIPAGKPGLKERTRIRISGVGYCYNHIVAIASKMPTSSGSCMINVNCEEGNKWQTEKKGVVQMTMLLSGGWSVCSGTMINNTAEDLTPYLLSAYHCYYECPEDYLDQWQFRFHYESPDCQGTYPEDTKTLVGCSLRTAIPILDGSDGLLVELNDAIPENWDVYFNGWDRRNNPVGGQGVGIHHPKGDIKKISTFETYSTMQWAGQGGNGNPEGHWGLQWTETPNGQSVIEGGSSGSPLFGNHHLVVGTLTGGDVSCLNKDGYSHYGKLWFHWDQYGDSPATQMRTWLDPLGTGAETLQGTYYFSSETPRIAIDKYALTLEGQVDTENPAQEIAVQGFNLETPIKAEATGDFALSSDQKAWGKTTDISPNGGTLYVRYQPSQIGNHEGQITLSNESVKKVQTIALSASSCPEIRIANAQLPNGKIGQDYAASLDVAGGEAPYVFEAIEGTLPQGVTLAEDGSITGIIEQEGLFEIVVSITDKNSCTSLQTVSLYVACDVIELFPFGEDFENEELLSCWTTDKQGGEPAWQVASGVSPEYAGANKAWSGEHNLMFWDESYGKTAQISTPQLNLEDTPYPDLRFRLLMPAWDGDHDQLRVLYKSSAHAPLEPITAFESDVPEWEEVRVKLPNPTNEYFIVFEATSGYGYGIGIDSVSVRSGKSGITIESQDTPTPRISQPTESQLLIQWEGETDAISIYSIAGQNIYSNSQTGRFHSLLLDVSSWNKGVYLLRTTDKDRINTQKFIIE